MPVIALFQSFKYTLKYILARTSPVFAFRLMKWWSWSHALIFQLKGLRNQTPKDST